MNCLNKKKNLLDLDSSIEKFTLKNIIIDSKVVEIYDGDSVKVIFKLFDKKIFKWNCRLNGINTPEFKTSNKEIKKYGIYVRDILRNKILDKIVKIKCYDFDKYGRLLIDIYLENIFINEWLVHNNLAVKYDGKTKDITNWSNIIKIQKIDNQSPMNGGAKTKKYIPTLAIISKNKNLDLIYSNIAEYKKIYYIYTKVEELKNNFKNFIDDKNVNAITIIDEDLFYLFDTLKTLTNIPVFISPLILIPSFIPLLDQKKKIVIINDNLDYKNNLERVSIYKNFFSVNNQVTILNYKNTYDKVIDMKIFLEKILPDLINKIKLMNIQYIFVQDRKYNCIINILKSKIDLPVYNLLDGYDFYMKGLISD